MTPAIRLGVRLVRGRDLVLRLRSALTALGSAICVMLLFGILAAWHVSQVAGTRNVAQAPHPDSHGMLLYAAVPDVWQGESLTRVYLAADGPHPPVPPGLSGLPAPGEAVLSPDLAAGLRRHDPQLQARFGGLRISVIGRAGLTSAGQQLAYIGSTSGALRGAPRVSGFGDAGQVTGTIESLKLASLLALIVFVGVPYAGVCAVATRLGAAARRRRMAALWMIGIRPRQLRLAGAVESAVSVFAGAIIGSLAFQALRPVLAAHVTINGIRPFVADLGLPVLQQAVVMLAVVVLAIVSGSLLGGLSVWRGTRPLRGSHRFDALPLILVGIGAALALGTALFVAAAPGRSAAWRDLLLDATAASLVLGAALSLAMILQHAGRFAARLLPSGSTLLAARRLETDPGAMARIGALVLVAVFAVGFAATIATQFQLSNAEAHAEARLGGRQVGTVLTAATDAPLRLNGIEASVVLPHLTAHDTNGASFDVLVASCPQLQALTGQSLRCPDEPFLVQAVDPQHPAWQLRQLPSPSPAGNLITLRSTAGTTLTLTYPVRAVQIQLSWASGIERDTVVVPPDDPGLNQLGSLPVTYATVAVRAGDNVAIGALRSSVARVDPTAEVDLAGAQELSSDAGYARYGTTVLLLALVACAVGLAGIAIAALDTVLVRLRHLQPLLVLGIPRRALRRSIAVEIAVPLVLATVLGVGIAVVCGGLFIQNDYGAHLPAATMTLTGTIGLIVAVLVALTGAVLVPQTPNRVSARIE
jgi:hypothetical protein